MTMTIDGTSPSGRSRALIGALVSAVLVAGVLVWNPAPASAAPASFDNVPVAGDRLNGVGRAVLVVGNTVYVGGEFTQVRNQGGGVVANRTNLAAFDATTGRLITSFRADANGTVRALATDGSRLFVGGSFRNINGTRRDRLAAVDLASGDLIGNWQANTNSNVYALAYGGGSLYAGGSFSSVNGSTHRRLVKVSGANGGVDQGFDAEANATVHALAARPDGSRIWAGGGFTSINGGGPRWLSGLDGQTGDLEGPSFGPLYGAVLALDLSDDGQILYSADTSNYGAAFSVNNGGRLFRQVCGGDGQAVVGIDDSMFTGFHEECEGDYSIRITSNDGSASGQRDLDFIPSFDRFWGIHALSGNTSVLAAAGDFTQVSGVAAQGFVLFRGQDPAPPRELVGQLPSDAVWRYLDDGSNQGTAWRNPGFDDSSWASGPAELGYGDGDEATVVGFGPNANDKYPTTYFRTTFEVGATPNEVDLRLVADDGAIVYVNGVEVARDNMPGGAIDFQTYAASGVAGGAESEARAFTIPAAVIQPGTNTVAVEVHQVGAGSSDISMSALINAWAPAGTPTTTTTSTTTTTTAPTTTTTSTTTTTLPPGGTPPQVPLGSTWSYLNDGSDQGTAWRNPGFNDNSWATGASQLGYGDGDEATVIPFGPDPSQKPLTTYYRHEVSATALPTSATIRLMADDAAVVYVNGVEVVRDNLPGGTIDSGTYASTGRWGAAESELRVFNIPTGAFVAGTNVIAVEVHQDWRGSSDQSFDFSLATT